MSNWSCIIITFSGIDKEVKDGGQNSEGKRIYKIRDAYNKELLGTLSHPLISYSCGMKSIGNACECVAIFHCNHFCVDTMVDVLKSFKWEYKEEVEIFWKSEEMDNYECIRPFKKES